MSQAQPNQGRHNNSAAKAAIFVVDDEPMLLELAVVILEQLGYELYTFRDPKTALQSFGLHQPPPALVITDYAMHDMNGMELITECRRIHPRQKVLLLSGTVDELIYHNAPVKPDRFLAKPYQANQLLETVNAILHG
jgi:DNA-binding NtrC family response regulator